MSIDKIRFSQGQSQDLWPQLPSKPAQEVPLDQYVPAPNWKRQLGVDVVARARRLKSHRTETPKSKTLEISFRLLGKDYRWSIQTQTSTVVDPKGNVIGKAHLEPLNPDKRDDLQFFDVTLADGKKEIFGYIAKDGSVPFSCLTRRTPRAEKIEIVRIIERFNSIRLWWRRDRGDDKYLDKVLRRLDDVDMLNSFIEQFIPLIEKHKYDHSRWAAQRLISILESSATPSSKRVELTMKLLPLAIRDSTVRQALEKAMARGLSRNFITTMKRFLKMMLDSENRKQRSVVACILMYAEADKAIKNRFFWDISDILDAVRPVFEDVQDENLAEALHEISRRNNHSLPVIERVVNLCAILLNSNNVSAKRLAVQAIGNICAYNRRADLRLLRRCLELIKSCLDLKLESNVITSALAGIAQHANADSDLANEALKLLWLKVEEVEPKKKPDVLAKIAGLIDSPNDHFGRSVVQEVLKRLEILSNSSDKEVAKRVAWAFSSYLEEQKLEKDDLYKAAVIMKRLGDKHHDEKSVLDALAYNYGWLAANYNSDDRTFEVCYQFLAPLAGDPDVTYAFNGLGSLIANYEVSKEILENALRVLFNALSHTNKYVRSSAAGAFRKLRLNYYIGTSQLMDISRGLLGHLENEAEEYPAERLIYGLEGVCENHNADSKLLRLVLHGVVPYLKDARARVSEQAFDLLESMAKNNKLSSDLAHSLAKLLLVPLLDNRKEERNEAAHSLEFLIKRFPDMDEEVKKALRIHHAEGRFYREDGIDVDKIRRELEDADPEIREHAARNARFIVFTPPTLRSDIHRLRSLPELKAVMDALKTSSHDSDYYVKWESKVSRGIIAFVIEDKSLPTPERQPMIIVPDLSSAEVVPNRGAVRPTYKQKQHHIFRRFAIIPLNNTRRFSEGELKFIYEGLKALPYEVLGGFYTIIADEADYDRQTSRALFEQGQVKFKGGVVTIPDLFHEIGHSVFKGVLTDKQRRRFIKLHKDSKTDGANYASGYASHDVDEDFAEAFTEWTMDSEGFLSLAIKQCQSGKPILLEKILLVTEVLSSGGSFVPTYAVRGAKINKGQLSITRYNDGKIKSIAIGGVTHKFVYDPKERLFTMDGKGSW